MALMLESCDGLPPDIEPKLKYHHLENDVKNILLKDAASCVCVHDKFICLGTQSGNVHLLDHQGNSVSIGTHPGGGRKEIQAHTSAVNQISIDRSGEYIATCSDDGKVCIYGLHTSRDNRTIAHGSVVKTIALDPFYYKSGSAQRFLTGDTNLKMNERTLMNRSRSTVLYKSGSGVRNIAWKDRFVAWASDKGVRVYDLVPKRSLGLIEWKMNILTPIEDYRCNLTWADEKKLMIGWLDIIKICILRKRSGLEMQSENPSEYLVEIMFVFKIDYHICGLGPLGEQLVVLGLPKVNNLVTGKSQRPLLSIANYQDRVFIEVSSDSLDICGYEEYSCNQYHLHQVTKEKTFYIVSPKDIVVASLYDVDDRVGWLMKNRRYEKAVSVLEKSGGKTRKHSVSDVGTAYLDYLLAQKLYKDAAILCAKVCRNNKVLWESNILKFDNVNQLRLISKYIPKTLKNKLSQSVYELILDEYLKMDLHGFLKVVRDWDPALYNISVVRKNVLSHLVPTSNREVNEACNKYILEALAILYSYEKKYTEAMKIYLRLGHKDIFKIMRRFNIYTIIPDGILALMKLDWKETISILLNECKVSPECVEKQLKDNDIYLFRYLDAHIRIDADNPIQGKLVRLYAKYAPEKLMPFLIYGKYDMQEALEVCQSFELYLEKVHLLGRSGNTKKALQIILEKLSDINQAITFCEEHNDMELWIDLINHSVEKPDYVTLLLQRIGTFVDPTVLINKIKPETAIGDLKDSLVKMMSDRNLQMSVQEAYKAFTFQRYFELQEKLIRNQRRGISGESVCSVCHREIIKDLSHALILRVHNCGHSFHVACLSDNLRIESGCPLCCAVEF